MEFAPGWLEDRRISKKKRPLLDAGLNAKIAPEGLRNNATVAELAAKYQLRRESDGTDKEVSREAKISCSSSHGSW